MTNQDPYPGSDQKTNLGIYLRMVRRYRPLDRAKEKELARRARGGSRAARDRLVGPQLRFVVGIARIYCGRGLGMMDLIAEGNLGIEKAANRYDEDRDGRFTPFALRAARREIERAVRAQQPSRSRPDEDMRRATG